MHIPTYHPLHPPPHTHTRTYEYTHVHIHVRCLRIASHTANSSGDLSFSRPKHMGRNMLVIKHTLRPLLGSQNAVHPPMPLCPSVPAASGPWSCVSYHGLNPQLRRDGGGLDTVGLPAGVTSGPSFPSNPRSVSFESRRTVVVVPCLPPLPRSCDSALPSSLRSFPSPPSSLPPSLPPSPPPLTRLCPLPPSPSYAYTSSRPSSSPCASPSCLAGRQTSTVPSFARAPYIRATPTAVKYPFDEGRHSWLHATLLPTVTSMQHSNHAMVQSTGRRRSCRSAAARAAGEVHQKGCTPSGSLPASSPSGSLPASSPSLSLPAALHVALPVALPAALSSPATTRSHTRSHTTPPSRLPSSRRRRFLFLERQQRTQPSSLTTRSRRAAGSRPRNMLAPEWRG